MPLTARRRNLLPSTGQTEGNYDDGCDGDYQAGYVGTRFVTVSGIVTDHATGLMWPANHASAPGTPFDVGANWTTGLSNCEALDYGGYTDWRMPNFLELVSLHDFGAGVRPSDYPAFTLEWDDPYYYWSSTTSLNNTSCAMRWRFWKNPIGSELAKASELWVIPVRGGRFNA